MIKMDWSNEETSPLRRTVLRRSARKCSMPSVSRNPPPAKKLRKVTPIPSQPAPTLITLPYVVTTKLLLYLDVETLENLSSTCSFFDQMIAGKFLSSINFPFPADFISEVMNADCLYKKPLLKLRCKNKKAFPDFSVTPMNQSLVYRIIVNKCCGMTDYLVLSQMSLLFLNKLREMDLMPDSLRLEDIWVLSQSRNMNVYTNFDSRLLRQMSRLGSLSHVTRLDVLVDQNFYLEQFMTQLPNLIELGLNIITSTGLSKRMFITEYLPRLEAVVAVSKAPVLKLTVIYESSRRVNKVLKNSYIEKLIVTGPCTLNIFPVMERLKEVTVKFNTNNCSYWKSEADDTELHRAGLCCVNMGAMYKNCPNMEKFMGIEVGMIDQKQTFNKWNMKIKKMFYEYHQNMGGSKELKAWAKTRWFFQRSVVASKRMVCCPGSSRESWHLPCGGKLFIVEFNVNTCKMNDQLLCQLSLQMSLVVRVATRVKQGLVGGDLKEEGEKLRKIMADLIIQERMQVEGIKAMEEVMEMFVKKDVCPNLVEEYKKLVDSKMTGLDIDQHDSWKQLVDVLGEDDGKQQEVDIEEEGTSLPSSGPPSPS